MTTIFEDHPIGDAESRAAREEPEWRRRAEVGDVGAMYNLGVLYADRGQWGDSCRWYRRAAQAGYIDAMFNLAVVLEDSGEHAEARNWYERAAEAGDIEARTSLLALLEDDDPPTGDGMARGRAAHPSSWAGDSSQPPGWWQASDGNWYPPEPQPPLSKGRAHTYVCWSCRAAFASVSNFCPRCGASTDQPQPPPNYAPTTVDTGNGYGTAGIICGAIAFLLLPPLFGAAGLILGGVALSRREHRAPIAMAVSGAGLVVGLILGMVVWSAVYR